MSNPAPTTRSQVEEIDDVTLTRVRRGDAAAARTFFERYHRQVFGFLWRMLGSRASVPVVEDLTQETFLRGFGGLSNFSSDGVARLSTWLLTIASHLAFNELRRQRRRGGDGVVELDRNLVSNARADEIAERKALGARLAREIEKLSPDHRAIFLLREYHDLSYQEIATALELELGTVQSRLARARAALREALEDLS